MKKEEKRKQISLIIEELKKIYPEATCALEFDGAPWKLLVMGRLSAQCTDARVNIVCRELFATFPTCESLAAASYEEIEEIIRPCGLFRTKAKNIKDACKMLCEDYGVPSFIPFYCAPAPTVMANHRWVFSVARGHLSATSHPPPQMPTVCKMALSVLPCFFQPPTV